MTKREFASYVLYFTLTSLIISTHSSWSFSLRSYVDPSLDPVYQVYRGTTDSINYGLRFVDSREKLIDRINQLQRENKNLRRQVYRGRAALRENRQLRHFLDLPPRPAEKLVPVEIIGRNLTNWERTLRVNRGSEDGLSKNQLVVQIKRDTWVVRGSVLSTTDENGVIALSSDPRFKIGARIVGVPGRQFVARGAGYDGLTIRNFPSFINVRPGNKVFTSSASTLAPQQLFLGRLSVVRDAGGESDIGRLLTISPPEFRSETLLWVVVSDG